MELTRQKWANIKQGSSIFGKTPISIRRLPFGVNVMLNLSNISIDWVERLDEKIIESKLRAYVRAKGHGVPHTGWHGTPCPVLLTESRISSWLTRPDSVNKCFITCPLHSLQALKIEDAVFINKTYEFSQFICCIWCIYFSFGCKIKLVR